MNRELFLEKIKNKSYKYSNIYSPFNDIKIDSVIELYNIPRILYLIGISDLEEIENTLEYFCKFTNVTFNDLFQCKFMIIQFVDLKNKINYILNDFFKLDNKKKCQCEKYDYQYIKCNNENCFISSLITLYYSSSNEKNFYAKIIDQLRKCIRNYENNIYITKSCLLVMKKELMNKFND